jgi:hypothetical protein
MPYADGVADRIITNVPWGHTVALSHADRRWTRGLAHAGPGGLWIARPA